ncbi:MAG: cation:proton antiporter, partial [Chloroflexota bacterium]|nr:cation:proton antiporter [Chloroflexota bacterium]
MAGFILGPFLLPGFSVQHTESIRRLADLGLILLLFGIGLEFGWQRIRRVGLQVLFIGAAETLFMLALGYQVGRFLGWSSTDS